MTFKSGERYLPKTTVQLDIKHREIADQNQLLIRPTLKFKAYS